ncbi:VaFE repeat-containing surface-anchored protein [Corynebacterium macginleyi]|uniref:VaFE repeat-containing surface-anchored protein n=1 Tax=Corynebacterium macginleyi TaxID=38290 RepID=UPI00160555A1|nr:VaFE repeat-containing surface-anchored protein [Corynebacterium macginleyi]
MYLAAIVSDASGREAAINFINGNLGYGDANNVSRFKGFEGSPQEFTQLTGLRILKATAQNLDDQFAADPSVTIDKQPADAFLTIVGPNGIYKRASGGGQRVLPPDQPGLPNDSGREEKNPEIRTEAKFAEGSTRVVNGAVVTDTVTYEGLVAGKKYQLDAKLMSKDGETVLGSGKAEFTPESANGSTTVDITVDNAEEPVEAAVAFEELTSVEVDAKGDDTPNAETPNKIAEHKDLKDEKQTVTSKETLKPSIKTEAKFAEGSTRVVNGAVVTDTVTYEGLVAGKKYQLDAKLMSKDGETVLGSGKAEFTPESANGSTTVDITVDNAEEPVEAAVAFEELTSVEVDAKGDDTPNAETPNKIAEHKDIDDKDQTVVSGEDQPASIALKKYIGDQKFEGQEVPQAGGAGAPGVIDAQDKDNAYVAKKDQDLTVTFAVENTGKVDLKDVKVTDELITGEGFESSELSAISPEKQDIAQGETKYFTATLKAPAAGKFHGDKAKAAGTPVDENGKEIPWVNGDGERQKPGTPVESDEDPAHAKTSEPKKETTSESEPSEPSSSETSKKPRPTKVQGQEPSESKTSSSKASATMKPSTTTSSETSKKPRPTKVQGQEPSESKTSSSKASATMKPSTTTSSETSKKPRPTKVQGQEPSESKTSSSKASATMKPSTTTSSETSKKPRPTKVQGQEPSESKTSSSKASATMKPSTTTSSEKSKEPRPTKVQGEEPSEGPVTPKITTDADFAEGSHVVVAGAKIVDEVSYEGLVPGKEYTLKAELINKKDGKTVLGTGEKTFTPEKSAGKVDVEITVNADVTEPVEAAVAFEELTSTQVNAKGEETPDATPENPNHIAEHKDINDDDQTVISKKDDQSPSKKDEKPKPNPEDKTDGRDERPGATVKDKDAPAKTDRGTGKVEQHVDINNHVPGKIGKPLPPDAKRIKIRSVPSGATELEPGMQHYIK